MPCKRKSNLSPVTRAAKALKKRRRQESEEVRLARQVLDTQRHALLRAAVALDRSQARQGSEIKQHSSNVAKEPEDTSEQSQDIGASDDSFEAAVKLDPTAETSQNAPDTLPIEEALDSRVLVEDLPYLVIKKMSKPTEIRIDPMLLLPEEEMSYEIRKKKKKKKKKNKEDPLKDCIDLEEKPPVVIEYDCNLEGNVMSLDPDVTIKVEDVDLDFHGITAADEDFNDHDDYQEPNHEPEVSFEDTDTNNDTVILTFQKNIKKEHSGVIQHQDIKIETQEEYASDVSYDADDNGVLCKICHMVFKNLNTLTIHKARKHNIRKKSFTHICQYCGFAYEQKTSLATHIKRKHKNINPEDYEDKTCPVCSLVFKGSCRLRMHMQRKHDTTPPTFKYKCSKCKLSYERRTSLLTHKRRKHNTKRVPIKRFKCRLCPNIYTNRDTYVRHLQRNHDPDQTNASIILDGLIKRHKTTGDLPCSVCPMMFSKLSSLKLHMRRHHSAFKDEYRIKCPHCDMSYDKNESLKRHLLRKHSNNMYCDVCHKNFSSKEEYDSHRHKKPVLECTLCNEIFASKNGLSKHMRCTHKIDSGGKRVSCPLCSEAFHENRQLKTHMVRDHLKIKYPCKLCNKVFKTKDSFQNHCTKRHSDNLHTTADYTCSSCNVSFSTERELCSHKFDIHRVPIPITDNGRNIKIEVNDGETHTQLENEHKDDEDSKEIKNHIDGEITTDEKDDKDFSENTVEVSVIKEEVKEVVITENKPSTAKIELKQTRRVLYDCTKCPEQFTNFPLLRQHFEQKHKLMEETQCQSCGEILLLRDLDKHTKTKHAVKTILKCDFCDFETTTKSTFSQHTLRHKNTTSIPCTFEGCRYKSFYKEAMEKHLKKHRELGEKLQCSRCPFQTMNKYILRYHEEEHETGNKKYKCDQCNYATILPANLVQHKFKHSTEKRFKCESCPFATKYNTSLRFHVRKKHCDLPNSVE